MMRISSRGLAAVAALTLGLAAPAGVAYAGEEPVPESSVAVEEAPVATEAASADEEVASAATEPDIVEASAPAPAPAPAEETVVVQDVPVVPAPEAPAVAPEASAAEGEAPAPAPALEPVATIAEAGEVTITPAAEEVLVTAEAVGVSVPPDPFVEQKTVATCEFTLPQITEFVIWRNSNPQSNEERTHVIFMATASLSDPDPAKMYFIGTDETSIRYSAVVPIELCEFALQKITVTDEMGEHKPLDGVNDDGINPLVDTFTVSVSYKNGDVIGTPLAKPGYVITNPDFRFVYDEYVKEAELTEVTPEAPRFPDGTVVNHDDEVGPEPISTDGYYFVSQGVASRDIDAKTTTFIYVAAPIEDETIFPDGVQVEFEATFPWADEDPELTLVVPSAPVFVDEDGNPVDAGDIRVDPTDNAGPRLAETEGYSFTVIVVERDDQARETAYLYVAKPDEGMRFPDGAVVEYVIVLGHTEVDDGNDKDSTKNHASYWEKYFADLGYQGVVCIKDDNPSTPYVVPAPLAGREYLAVILKAGSDQSTENPHQVVQPVKAGDKLSHESGKDNSHVILCTVPSGVVPPGDVEEQAKPSKPEVPAKPGKPAVIVPSVNQAPSVALKSNENATVGAMQLPVTGVSSWAWGVGASVVLVMTGGGLLWVSRRNRQTQLGLVEQ